MLQAPATHWGEGWWVVVCDECGASWVGQEGDPCYWCWKAQEAQLALQRDLLLHPPEGANHQTWLGRLARAVAAETISEQEAEVAVQKWEHQGL